MNKTVSYQGKDISYRLEGSGEPLMLLHGFAEDGHIWDEQVDYLSDQFKVIVPDIPGSGNSTYNKNLQTIEELAGPLCAIADTEKIEKFSLIGHSMGGYIALAFAELFRSRLIALGLFHSTAYADGPEKITARKGVIARIQNYGVSSFMNDTEPYAFSTKTKNEHPWKIRQIINRYANFNGESLVSYQEAMIGRPDRTAVLEKSGLPVLLIMGEEDTVIPLNDGLRQSYLPELCYIHILKNAGIWECWKTPLTVIVS